MPEGKEILQDGADYDLLKVFLFNVECRGSIVYQAALF
jgi:hypothetical protein